VQSAPVQPVAGTWRISIASRGHAWWQPFALVAFTAAAAAAIISRRPDAVTNPQFWAEDGHYWFAEAYNSGALHMLVMPHTGYFQTLARSTSALSQPFGLAAAPLIFNTVALAIQLAPALFFLSSRFEHAAPRLWVRYVLATIYVLLPNSEVHANLTNAQWHLAILACMVLIAAPSPRLGWRIFDIAAWTLSALSGPFVIILVPIALVRWLVSRRRWHLALTAIAVPMALLQAGTSLASAAGTRPHGPLGAGVRSTLQMFADRVVVTTMVGQEGNSHIYSSTWPHGRTLALVIATAALGVVGYAVVRGGAALRIFSAFVAGTFAISLLSPLIDRERPEWPLILTTPTGSRYFFLPMLGWAVCVVWLLSRLPRLARALGGAAVVAVFGVGLGLNWQYPPFADLHPDASARQLDRATPGTQVSLPINPPGWTMDLRRH